MVGTDNVILITDTVTKRIKERLDIATSGSFTIYDLNVTMTDIPERLLIRLVNKVAIILWVHGLVNISIVDLIHGYDEDILRYKNVDKGIFVPNNYMSATPAVDQSDRGNFTSSGVSQSHERNEHRKSNCQ